MAPAALARGMFGSPIASRVGWDSARVELSLLRAVSEERRARWRHAGLTCELVEGPPTDEPASWLILGVNDALGQLTVWVSGEAEMDWGTPDDGGSRHYDLESRDDLNRCVDDLEAALRGLG